MSSSNSDNIQADIPNKKFTFCQASNEDKRDPLNISKRPSNMVHI